MPPVGERDYDAPETMIVSDPAQLKAMADPFRVQLVQLMRDEARSTQQLAEELGIPKGTVGHHLKVLERAGLIKVVRTRKVRAMTEKFYGRTARLFLYQTDDPDNNRTMASNTLRHAAGEVEAGAYTTGFGLVRARLSKADKRRFNKRAQQLLDDFRSADAPDGEPWSMTLGLWTPEGCDEDQ